MGLGYHLLPHEDELRQYVLLLQHHERCARLLNVLFCVIQQENSIDPDEQLNSHQQIRYCWNYEHVFVTARQSDYQIRLWVKYLDWEKIGHKNLNLHQDVVPWFQ